MKNKTESEDMQIDFFEDIEMERLENREEFAAARCGDGAKVERDSLMR